MEVAFLLCGKGACFPFLPDRQRRGGGGCTAPAPAVAGTRGCPRRPPVGGVGGRGGGLLERGGKARREVQYKRHLCSHCWLHVCTGTRACWGAGDGLPAATPDVCSRGPLGGLTVGVFFFSKALGAEGAPHRGAAGTRDARAEEIPVASGRPKPTAVEAMGLRACRRDGRGRVAHPVPNAAGVLGSNGCSRRRWCPFTLALPTQGCPGGGGFVCAHIWAVMAAGAIASGCPSAAQRLLLQPQAGQSKDGNSPAAHTMDCGKRHAVWMRREEAFEGRAWGGSSGRRRCAGRAVKTRIGLGMGSRHAIYLKTRWVGAPAMRSQRSPSDGLDLWTLTTTSRTGGRKAVFCLLLSMHLIGRENGGTDQYIPIFTNVAERYLAFEQFTSATHGNFT